MGAPRHAANDSSFGRSATATAVRGGLLLALAVVLGIVLLRANPGASSNTGTKPANPPVVSETSTSTSIVDNSVAPPQSLITTTTSSVAVAGGHPPGQVAVLVTNGSGITGKGRSVNSLLSPGGWKLLAPTTAAAKNLTSTIYVQPGYEQDGAAIAAQFTKRKVLVKAISELPPIVDPLTANVVVVVGKALANSV